MNLDFIRADRPSFLLPVPPPPRQSSSPSCSPILFAKLFANPRRQLPSSVGAAGPQLPASDLSGHRWASTASVSVWPQWAPLDLRTDLNRRRPIAVGTAGSENMPNKMSKDMPKRLSEDMPKECQKEGEEICQTESQKICKKEERTSERMSEDTC